MTLQDVNRLFRYWQRHPPGTAILMAIASTLGIKYSPPTEPSNIIQSSDAAIAALEQFNRAGIRQHQ